MRAKGEAIFKNCKRCKHSKMWESRGLEISTYKYKCCKCGYKIKHGA